MKQAGLRTVVMGMITVAAGCCCQHQAAGTHTDGSEPRPAVVAPPARGTLAEAAAPHRTPAAERTVNGDVIVEQALFGSGTKLVDVTDRVVELLRSEPQGFKAEADWLRVDPVPGKTKSLWIRYVYRDTPRMFMVSLNNRASYQAMIAGAAAK